MADVVTFEDEVVAAVTGHMNGDHPDDVLLIVHGLGAAVDTELKGATAATMVGFDSEGGDYLATVDGQDRAVRIPFFEHSGDRRAIRKAIVHHYRDACEALGIEPREGE